MSEPILIPIKASEEKPEENGIYHVVTENNHPVVVRWKNGFWWHDENQDEKLMFRLKLEFIIIWYKPVSIDELLPSYNDLTMLTPGEAKAIINHIKSKLTEK